MWPSLVLWKYRYLALAIQSSRSLVRTPAPPLYHNGGINPFYEDEYQDNESAIAQGDVVAQCDIEVLPHNEA